MKLIKLSDREIDKISSEWTKLPADVKDQYKNLFFNMVDKRIITDTGYNIITNLIKKHNPEPSKEESNIQYINYNDGQFKYMDKLYSMTKPNKFISDLINKAKKNGKLTKSQDYYLMYYLKNGESPYDAKLLPNNI